MSYSDWQDPPIYPDEYVPRIPGMEDPMGGDFRVPDYLSAVPTAPQIPVGGTLLPEDAPPAFPDLITPAVASMPQPGFRERLAAGLANMPGYQPQPYEGGASRFGRGLLAGAARGFSGGTLLGMKNQQAQVDAKNVENKTAADRANALRMEAWKDKLKAYYDEFADERGKVTVTEEQAKDSGLPVGSLIDPKDIASATAARVTANRAQEMLEETKRHNRATEANMERDKVAGVGAFKWTPTGEKAIAAAQSELIAARNAEAAGTSLGTTAVEEATRRLDAAMKRDFASQLRSAKTLQEARALVDRMWEAFPEWGNSPMLDRVAEDKLHEFGAKPTR